MRFEGEIEVLGFLSSNKLLLDVIGHVNLRNMGFLGFLGFLGCILGGRERPYILRVGGDRSEHPRVCI